MTLLTLVAVALCLWRIGVVAWRARGWRWRCGDWGVRGGCEQDERREDADVQQRPSVYADYAGCPPVPPGLVRACLGRLEEQLARGVLRNPHSERVEAGGGTSSTLSSSSSIVDALRVETLRYCRASSREYVFVLTSGATAGCRIVGEVFGVDEFAYLVDNHTSVVGVSGVAGRSRAVAVADLFEVEGGVVEEREGGVQPKGPSEARQVNN